MRPTSVAQTGLNVVLFEGNTYTALHQVLHGHIIFYSNNMYI